MTRSIIMSWRNYQPYGKEFYDPLWYGFLKNLKLWANEFDKLYILDSQWNFTQEDIRQLSLVKENFEIIVTDPSLRYYDAYKKHLPEVKEDLVLFLDNDMLILKPKIIDTTFWRVDEDNYDGVSIFDTIGTWKTDSLNGKNKFCPYFFCTRKEVLKEYLDIEWGPEMPDFETLGRLTKNMVNNGLVFWELPEDKTDFPTKDLGYYHIRAGSTPAWLLAEKHYGNKETYFDYLKNQPRSEYLRHAEWYKRLGGDPSEIIEDSKVYEKDLQT